MEFSTLVIVMGIFYLLVFVLSFVENYLEQRRARNFNQNNLSRTCLPQQNYNSRVRTPSPNELPYYDSASGRQSGPSINCDLDRKITRMTIETSTDDDKVTSNSQTTFECYVRGNQWVCSPAQIEDNTRLESRNWEDSHESVPHCLHGQDRFEVPRVRQTSKESLEYNEPSHHRLSLAR